MKEISRRSLLYHGSFLTAAALSGCCSVSKSVIPATQSPAKTLLIPSVSAADDTRLSVIDSHAHFFNASDLNAIGYLSGPILTDLPLDDGLRSLFETLIRTLELIGRKFPPSAYREWIWLDAIESELATKRIDDSVDINSVLQREFDNHDNEIIRELSKRLATTDFLDRYYEQIDKIIISPLKASEKLSLEDLIRRDISYAPGELLLGEDRSISASSFRDRHPGGLIPFLVSMLRYRFQNVAQHWSAFQEDSKHTCTKHAFGAMVDFDLWLDGCDTAYSRSDNQIKLFERIAKLTDGYLMPLVSFNPWKALTLGEEYKSLIDRALKNDVYRGVKIYPQIGYAPGGNGDNPYSGGRGTPDPSKIQRELNWLYERCQTSGKTVMAHAEYSKGKIPDYSNLGSPWDWEKVLNEYPELKVNAGHFGHTGRGWNAEFRNIMTERKNFYADTGFWDDLTEGDDCAIGRIKSTLSSSGTSSKLMHGSDWFMLQYKVRDWAEYNDEIYKVLSMMVDGGSLPRKAMQDYFYSNSARLFGVA